MTDRKTLVDAARKTEREKLPNDRRSAVALEQIADTLEELRTQMVGIAHLLGTISTTLAKKS